MHIRQRHTIDILVAEFICIGNWYNPFAWAIRHAIRQNLEFIADQKVLDNGIDRKGYQYHLLKVAGHPAYALANNFNFSSLKKRIIMMNKVRSTRLHLLKFAFILPLVAVLLVAFRHAPAATRSAGLALQDTIPPAGALWIVDGKEMHYSMKDVLNPQDISSMQVLSPDEGFRLLGDKGRNGVVAIITRAYLNARTPPHSTAIHIISQHAPIYIVNGMQVPKGIDWASLINPKEIASIYVLKDSAATARYGEDGAYGVIMISTKSFRNP